MNHAETTRIKFIIDRDGTEAAIAFTKRTLAIYIESLFRSRKHGYTTPHHASIPEYRNSFVTSCCTLRKFLRENKS